VKQVIASGLHEIIVTIAEHKSIMSLREILFEFFKENNGWMERNQNNYI
jgi:hypothetical protein